MLIASPELLAIHVPTPPPFFAIRSKVCEWANTLAGPSSTLAVLPQQPALEQIPNQPNVQGTQGDCRGSHAQIARVLLGSEARDVK